VTFIVFVESKVHSGIMLAFAVRVERKQNVCQLEILIRKSKRSELFVTAANKSSRGFEANSLLPDSMT
jgi:hypothetical protein